MRHVPCALPLTIAIALVLLSTTAWAGPWVPRRGAYYLQLSYAYQSAHELYDMAGNRVRLADGGTYSDRAAELYGEVGLGRRLALVLSLPAKWTELRRTGFEDLRNRGVADADVGVRWGTRSRSPVMALQVNARVALGYDEQAAPALGDGQNSVEVHGLTGSSWLFPLPGYVQGDLGLRVRGEGAADEWLYALDVGVWGTSSVLLSGFVRGVWSAGDVVLAGNQAIPEAQTSERYTVSGVGVAYRLVDGLFFRAEYSGVIEGESSLALSGWRFGVAVKRD